MRVIRIPYGKAAHFLIEDLNDTDYRAVQLRRLNSQEVWLEFDGDNVGIPWVISAEEVEALILVLQLLQKEIKDNE